MLISIKSIIVPSQKLVLMPLAATIFISLVIIDRYRLTPSIHRINSTIKRWILHRLGMHSRRNYLNASVYNCSSEKEINTSISAIEDIGKISGMMIVFLGDVFSIAITIMAFIFLAGSHYIPLLFVFLVYIFSELLMVSKNSSLSLPINSLPGSILDAFYANQHEWINAGLASIVSAQSCKYHSDLQIRQIRSKNFLGSMKVVDATINALVMVALTIIGLYLNSTSDEISGGGFLAGLLVIFRLISLSKSCSRSFYKSRALYQRSSKRIFPSLQSLVSSIKNDAISAQPNYEGLSRGIGQSRIDIRKVSITYRNTATNELQDVLKNINLVVKDGSKVVIYADRNQGLSTLIDCITGATKPNRGRVMINGMDTRFKNSNWNEGGIYLISKSILNYIADSRYDSDQGSLSCHSSVDSCSGSTVNPRYFIQDAIQSDSSPVLVIDRPEQFTAEEKDILFCSGVYDQKNTVITLTQRKEHLKTASQCYLLYRGILKKLSI